MLSTRQCIVTTCQGAQNQIMLIAWMRLAEGARYVLVFLG
jgi:hypothetical protein